MKRMLRTRRSAFALVVIAAAAAFAMLTAASSSHATVASHAVRPAISGGGKPDVSGPQHMNPGSVTFGCQSRPLDGSLGARCYQPAQIQNAYGYSGLLASGVNGTGKTIVIVDAFSNPFIPTDLSIQDNTFGLPAANYSTLAQPNPVPAFDPSDGNMVGWAEEITLDVLWAHAMAPGAKIVLAEAASNNDSDILATTKYVVDHHIGDVISQSFGEAEQCMDSQLLKQQNKVFEKAAKEGYTVFASSGDSGASQFNCDGTAPIIAASTPASDPNVTGVGGTTLDANTSTGAYIGETAWTEPFGCNPPDDDDVNCSGGGFSTVYPRPPYQAPAIKGGPHGNGGPPGPPRRGVPDVAYNAGVAGGVLTHCGVCNLIFGIDPTDPTIFFIFGGTSAGSPQWAALAADADQMAHHDIGGINDNLYKLAADHGHASHGKLFLHDITTGNNDVADLGGAGFDAGPGWDAVTGLGTPNAADLLPALVKPGPPGP